MNLLICENIKDLRRKKDTTQEDLYDFVISLVGEEQPDAPARFMSGVISYDFQYNHVPRMGRVSLRRGYAESVRLLPASRLS